MKIKELWSKSRDAVPDGFTQVTVYSDSDGGKRVATVFKEDAVNLITMSPLLLEACEFALHGLEDMTTCQFAKGGDKVIRERLEAAISAARG